MLLISRQSHKKGNIRTTSYTFLDNFNILKRFYGLCFFTGSDPINQWFLVKTIDKRVSEAQKNKALESFQNVEIFQKKIPIGFPQFSWVYLFSLKEMY